MSKADTLVGRVALVTGGSRGIGHAIALELARRGADVAVNYRSSEAEAEDVAREINAMGVAACSSRVMSGRRSAHAGSVRPEYGQ